MYSEWRCDMNKEYTTPSVQLLGTLQELTTRTTNGCGGNGQDKIFSNTDGFGHAETGCLVS
jgi:hypothetical protein